MKNLSIFSISVMALGIAKAGTVSPVMESPEAVISSGNDWEITLGLYGWGAGLDGDLGVAGIVAPVDLDFSDILETLDMTAMGMLEVRKGPWLAQLEGLYLRNTVKRVRTSPIGGGPVRSAKLSAETTRLEIVGGYRIVDNATTTVDLLGGAVYYNIENELTFFGPAAILPLSAGDDWIDPIIGVRVNHALSERWNLSGRAEVGGFGVNADLVWQLYGAIGYRLNDSTNLLLGWRHAAVDYQNGGFIYDVASSGPIFGVTVSW